MYYIIGDSHTSVFSSREDILPVDSLQVNGQFGCLHVGPQLAFNTKENSVLYGKCNLASKDDYFIFCFGEIDMRNIHKRITGDTLDYKTQIDLVVSNYFSFINSVGHDKKIVFGVVPCLKEVPFYNWFENNPERKNEFYAPVGDLATRNIYKEYYNSKLAQECSLYNIKYFDVFSESLNNAEFYMDDIHLSSIKIIDAIQQKLSALTS